MNLNTPTRISLLASAVASITLGLQTAHAYSTQMGEVNVQIDTTLSVGAGWRMSNIDYEGVGPLNAISAGKTGHKHDTSSQDNSNLLYEKGETYSELFKGTVDLELSYQNYGAFVRGRFWYDRVIVDGDGGNTRPAFYPTGEHLEPPQHIGRGGEFLDAFVWADWEIGENPVTVRLGSQVINWGEGVLFPNGINTISPVDVTALLAPGASLKEALIPVEALYGSVGLTPNLSVEAFYQLKWEQTRVPACGTFFSTSDLVGYESCTAGFYASGGEAGAMVEAGGRMVPARAFRLPRGADIEPDDDNQYGLALRYYIEAADMEIGAYYMNYHSRLPLISGTTPDLTNGIAGVPVPSGFINSTTDLRTVRGILTSSNPLGTIITLPYSQYNIEYPEDIQLFGLSFNTTIDFGLPGGATSVSGEISMRKDQPFQIEDGVSVPALLGLPSQSCADTNYDCYAKFGQRELVSGYWAGDYSQAEIAFVQFFDQVLGASRWTAILNVAGSYSDIPDKSELLLNSGYNTALATPWFPYSPTFPVAGLPDLSNPTIAGLANQAYEDEYYPTRSAWGYKLRFSGEYNNVFQGVNMIPTITWSHDVSGTTPSPISNFLEGRKSIGISTEFVYENTYSLKLGYTDFFGSEPYNQLADRDYFTLSASASF